MKKYLKNIIAMFLVVVLGLSLVACGQTQGTSSTEPDPDPATDPAPGAATTAPTEPEPTTEPETEMTVEEFFDKSAFIGDSVTLKLRNYNAKNGVLGDTTFLCQGSYSVAHAVNNTMMLSYQGSDISPQAALKACGADRVFILLGMNDIGLWGIDKTMENWAVLIANIRAECPDIDIYIQSGTPIYTGGEKGSLNNTNMDKYNDRLEVFAAENDCYFINVNTPFKDNTGGLAPKYCSDKYVHFTDVACELWVKILSQLV